jgi:putative ABC transport system substrate-binding protein
MIDRRTLIRLLAATAAITPLEARAQGSGGVRRVGLVLLHAQGDAEGQVRLDTFRRALRELGWTEGDNLELAVRWGAGEPARAKNVAEELVAIAPDVIVANGTAALAALQRATRTIPLVFAVVTDPIGAGFVSSLARPGGNITGFSTFDAEIGGKWLAILRETVPDLQRVGVVHDPQFKGFAAIWQNIAAAAPGLGMTATSIPLRQASDDLDSVIGAFAEWPHSGLVVLPTAINNLARTRIFGLAARHRLPAIYPFRLYATDGGLMAYGFDPQDLIRRSAGYVDRILKGEAVGDLPVQAPTKFELLINLKTAKALGLTIPPAVLLQATEAIE